MSALNEGTDLVPATGQVVDTQLTDEQIEAAGYLMPVMNIAALRAGQKQRQQILTQLLDPDLDFLYTVTYKDNNGKPRQNFFTKLKDAKDGAKFVAGVLTAHPKKSGCIKIAHALGIESREVRTEGLPRDQKATYSSSHFVAKHKRTGREEEGQGYCDKAEKPEAKNFVIISMANTRAYCHAVLRCAGYDNVGADEMGVDDEIGFAPIVYSADRPAFSEVSSATVIDVPAVEQREVVPVQSVVEEPVKAVPVAAPVAAARPTAPVAAPSPSPSPAPVAAAPAAGPAESAEGAKYPGKGDLITTAMAAELSKKLILALGDKLKARDWLLANAGVERSIHVFGNQNGLLHADLDIMLAQQETK